MQGILKNISFSSENIQIECIDTNNCINTINLSAVADCCSSSYYNIVDTDFEKFKGKKLSDIYLDIYETDDLIDMFDVTNIDGECIKTHYNKLQFEDGNEWYFLLVNDSNGYYDGWTDMETFSNPFDVTENKTKLILVVGLPGSGKTSYAEKYKEQNNELSYKIFIYDDIMSNYANGLFLKKIIDCDHKIILLTDPRFCIKSVFDGFIKEVQKYVCDTNIDVVLFENDKEQCLLNVEIREKNNHKLKSIINSLDKFYNYYDKNYESYKKFNCELLPVYK